jgi:hypothetical protein
LKCQNCGRENSDHFKFCLSCGSDLSVKSDEAARVEEQVAVLLKEAQDFEKFDMIDEAIQKIEQVVALSPDSANHRSKLDELKARRRRK